MRRALGLEGRAQGRAPIGAGACRTPTGARTPQAGALERGGPERKNAGDRRFARLDDGSGPRRQTVTAGPIGPGVALWRTALSRGDFPGTTALPAGRSFGNGEVRKAARAGAGALRTGRRSRA